MMNSFLVCFYSEAETDFTHRLIVRQENDKDVADKAKAYLIASGVPNKELSSFTVEDYKQGKIDGIDII